MSESYSKATDELASVFDATQSCLSKHSSLQIAAVNDENVFPVGGGCLQNQKKSPDKSFDHVKSSSPERRQTKHLTITSCKDDKKEYSVLGDQLFVCDLKDIRPFLYEKKEHQPTSRSKIFLVGNLIGEYEDLKLASYVDNEYLQIGSVSTERLYFASSVFNGSICLNGGRDGREGRDELEANYLNSVELLGPGGETTSKLPSMNQNRIDHACCVHDDSQLYACGGAGNWPSKCCEMLELSEASGWKFVADMNEARQVFRVVSCGSHIWAIGGKSCEGVLASIEKYDLKMDTWEISTSLIEERWGHVAVACRDKIFVIGGDKDDRETALNSAEVLDTATEQVSTIRPMKAARFRFAAAISGTNIFCFGGENDEDDDAFDTVESYSFLTGDWKDEAPLPKRYRELHALTIYDV